MALETLKGVKKVGGHDIVIMDELRDKHPEQFNESGQMNWEWFEKDIRPNYFIYVRNDKNSISFTIQDGPVKENGVNGCQVDSLIEAAMLMIKGLNENYPCRENSLAITKLQEALFWLAERKKDREMRGVEGHNKL